MTVQTHTSLFAWCSIIDIGVLLCLASIFTLAPELACRFQSRGIPISRETFNAAPCIALAIIG